MKIYKTINEYKRWRNSLPHDDGLGFIPTMGALHDGHKALIKEGVEENKHTVVSIFVNALQFNSQTDLETYPRTLEQDLKICEELGVSSVFAPNHDEMYSPGHSACCEVEGLDKYLCGASRPGHFKGVCTVVLKLFNIIAPTAAYFGQKDFQQARIIQRMVEDLKIETKISTIKTIREPSGLAISSRNLHLSPEMKEKAAGIYRGLSKTEKMFLKGEKDSSNLIGIAQEEILSSSPDKIDYLTIVSQKILESISKIEEPAVIAAAVFYGGIRLIDNVLLDPNH